MKTKVELYLDEKGQLYVERPDGTQLVIGGQCGLGSPVFIETYPATEETDRSF